MKKSIESKPALKPVPKLSGEVKAMNGKSSRKLIQCIDDLHCILDADAAIEPTVDDQQADE